MGNDCWLVWSHDDEIDLEAVFMREEDAVMYMTIRAEFVEQEVFPPTFHLTALPGGLYEPKTMP